MKKILSYMLLGLRTGGFIYLLVLAIQIQKSAPTASNIYSVLVMSTLIGLLSMIFESEQFSYVVLLLIHFIVTAILVCCMMWYNGWADLFTSFEFWLDFVLIYVFIWLFQIFSGYLQTQKINKTLFERRKKNNNRS